MNTASDRASILAAGRAAANALSHAVIVFDSAAPTGWRVYDKGIRKAQAVRIAERMQSTAGASLKHPETGIYAMAVPNETAAEHETPAPVVAPVVPPLVKPDYAGGDSLAWAFVVRDLFVTLEGAGFPVMAVDNGEGKETCAGDIGKAIEEATACDECHITCSTPSGEKGLWAFLVLGNAPSDLVSDFASRESADGREFDSVISAWSDKWDGFACPSWRTLEVFGLYA